MKEVEDIAVDYKKLVNALLRVYHVNVTVGKEDEGPSEQDLRKWFDIPSDGKIVLQTKVMYVEYNTF